jgi:hypothetical protein
MYYMVGSKLMYKLMFLNHHLLDNFQ